MASCSSPEISVDLSIMKEKKDCPNILFLSLSAILVNIKAAVTVLFLSLSAMLVVNIKAAI